jgi:hypothetical protein
MRVIVVAAFLMIAAPVSAQTEIKTNCLCQLGSDAKQFSAEIEVTDANRASLKRSIEAGNFDPRKIVKVTGQGCQPAEWRTNRLCGTTSVSTTRPDGTRESKSFDNTPVTGTKTFRITNTGNIPRRRDPTPGKVLVDEERWSKVRVILVGGIEQ